MVVAALMTVGLAVCCVVRARKRRPKAGATNDEITNGRSTLQSKVRVVAAVFKANYKEHLEEKLKSLITFYQLLSAFTQPASSGTEWPPEFLDFVNSIGSALNLDLISLFKAPCLLGADFDYFASFLSTSLVLKSAS